MSATTGARGRFRRSPAELRRQEICRPCVTSFTLVAITNAYRPTIGMGWDMGPTGDIAMTNTLQRLLALFALAALVLAAGSVILPGSPGSVVVECVPDTPDTDILALTR